MSCARDAPEILEAHLVVDVVLVEQGGLDHGEVARGRPVDLLAQESQPGLVRDRLVDADPLSERNEVALALERFEPVEDRTELRVRGDLRFLGDDGEPEVGRQDDETQATIVLGDEVFDRGEHPVTRPALQPGVGELEVHTAHPQFGDAGEHPRPPVPVPELLRDPRRLVVEVAPSVGPTDVVTDEQRQRDALGSHGRGEHLELVVHGEPVVVAVDERDVGRWQRRQHVVADAEMEDVPTGEGLLVLGRVELRQRIDHVELAVRAEPVEHAHGRLAPQRADLDHAPGVHRFDERGDDVVPEGKHRLLHLFERGSLGE